MRFKLFRTRIRLLTFTPQFIIAFWRIAVPIYLFQMYTRPPYGFHADWNYRGFGNFRCLATVAVPRYVDLEENARQKAIDTSISEITARESLTWADYKISTRGFICDVKVFGDINHTRVNPKFTRRHFGAYVLNENTQFYNWRMHWCLVDLIYIKHK